MTLSLKVRLEAPFKGLGERFVEREVPLILGALALLSRQNLLYLGPPGTAKSQLAEALAGAVGGKAFVALMTRHTTPDDIFGPLSIKALEDDRLERQSEGYLPTAHVAFLDEVYKSGPAILNTLLRVLNERSIPNGATLVKIPLRAAIVAANELPEEDDGLDAFDDRFLLRCEVPRLSDDGFGELLEVVDRPGPEVTVRLPLEEFADLDARAKDVRVGHTARILIQRLRAELARKRVAPSDRRFAQAIQVMKVMAAVDGSSTVRLGHLCLLLHALWRRPADAKVVHDTVRDLIAQSDFAKSVGGDAASQVANELRNIVNDMNAVSTEVRHRQVYTGTLLEADERRLFPKVGDLLHRCFTVREKLPPIRHELEAEAASGLWLPLWSGLVLPRLTKEIDALVDQVAKHQLVTDLIPKHFPAHERKLGVVPVPASVTS